MEQPKRSDDKYWIGARDFNEIQYAEDLERYIRVLEHHSDDLAIKFADWLEKLGPASRVSIWSKDGHHTGLLHKMDNEQLLEKYKRWITKK